MKPFEARKLLWRHIIQKPDADSNSSLSRVDFLRKITFFKGLSRWQIKQVSELLYERYFEPGEYLFEVGQPGAALFLIHSGKIIVEMEDEKGHHVSLASLESGSFIGELALLDQSPRSASAKSIQPVKAYALFRNDLEQLALKEPSITSHIYKKLAAVIGERLKATNELVKTESQNKAAA